MPPRRLVHPDPRRTSRSTGPRTLRRSHVLAILIPLSSALPSIEKTQVISDLRARSPNRPGRKLQDGDSLPDRQDDAKGFEQFNDFDDPRVSIHEEGINGETHPDGVNRVTPGDQKPVLRWQRGSPQQPHESPDEPIGYLDMRGQPDLSRRVPDLHPPYARSLLLGPSLVRTRWRPDTNRESARRSSHLFPRPPLPHDHH